ncbi:putative aldehyde dehydrogenase family protein [Lyophyllum shimeji]|uniref:Aldehyde dehydrogenase family protein n=1 Tax=Lyophyllum shimeji TaxID=47721 RepID=A0A9P3PGA0_LYOSH|nr:putative aldehyde dehydrogenase family protein [Lyophyllum shimeji]
MNALVSFILHPLIPVNVGYDDDEQTGIDVVYPLTIFFAFGIWLVVQRYHKMHNSAVPFYHAIPAAADPKWESVAIQNPHLESHLDKEEIMPHIEVPGRRYITSFDPATGLHLGISIADSEEEIQNKIIQAGEAQKEWSHTTFTQRRRVIRSLMKWLVDNQEVCARVACRDSGKTLIDAALGEILTTCSKMEWLINHGEDVLKPQTRAGNFMLSYKKSQVVYEPLGVVAAIVSWNYPLHNAWSPILAAIFAGNGVVLKCSENVIWSTTWFVGAIQECLRVCGHDADLVQVVCCYPEQADALTKSPLIKHITFIGSEEVGRKIARAATEHLTPVTLELGGKDPAIVLPGTDLNKWAPLWLRGIFQNMGQNCIGIERLIVHSSQYDELHDILSERITKLRVGSVLAPSPEGYVSTIDCGSMISRDRFPALEKIIRDAEEAGARVEGGVTYNHVYLENGAYFTPSLVGPVDSSMDIAQHELFAPIAVLMPYETIEEAVEIANGTRYGLGASVFGPDQRQALKVAKQLECGMVSINDFGVFYVNQDLPFGGTKYSGYGRFGGPEGLRSLTNVKAIMVDRWPSLVQTSIPKVLDYPMRSLFQSWEFSSGLIRFLRAARK